MSYIPYIHPFSFVIPLSLLCHFIDTFVPPRGIPMSSRWHYYATLLALQCQGDGTAMPTTWHNNVEQRDKFQFVIP